MPSNSMIVDWFVSLAISDMLTTDDILSGNTVNTILKKTIPGFKSDFVTPATALNKITNWNNLIKSLEKINIKVSADDKNSIFHGNQTLVYNILSQIKDHVDQNTKQPEVDINKIDYRSDPKQSKSLLELFILVIIKNLGLNAKQSVALLSNDSKYLAHILAKGFKDQPGPVINLLRDFQLLLPQIHQFCANKENEVFFLKSVKPGLISKFKEISELSLQILEQFSLETATPFEILKVHLIPTLVLQYRRHPVFLNAISHTMIKLSKYTKPLLTVLTNNMNQKELLTFSYEILTIAEDSNQIKNFFNLSKVEQVVTMSIDCLNDSNIFSIALLLLIKIIETNIDIVTNDPKNLNNTLNNLEHLAINKMEHFAAYVNGLFALLAILGTKKHPIAPQFFKLCIEKYKLAINYDESISYGYNFLHLIEDFPSIPTSAIVDAVVERYENYKEVITDLDIQLLTRVAFGFNRNSQDQERNEENFKIPDEKTTLKIYNILSKVFFEDISNAVGIADAIVFLVLSHPNSELLKDLNLKMVKVALAVHFGNIRKLNMSKSIVQGTIKLDYSNAFAKRKNMDIEYLLKELLNLKNEEFNKTIEPLICYSYIQSESKNRNEAQELGKVLSILGNVNVLVRKYEQEVRILHEEKRTKKKSYPTVDQEEQIKLNSASSDLIKKKKIPPGENYSMYLSRIQKITPDAKLGLLKAQKGFDDKKKKAELQELKRLEEQQKKEELQKKYTMKVFEKGIRVDAKAEFLTQYIYDFNTKENQLKKDQCYDLTSLHIFNPNEEQENDMQALKYLMKKYNKVLKILYSNYSGKLRPNSISCFDQMGEKLSLMQIASLWKMFKDFELDEFMTIREAQYLAQKINAMKKKSYHDTSLLDFEAFEDMIIQASLTMFTRPPKNLTGHTISQMVEETFYQFKMLAGQNRIDIRLFDDESTTFEQDEQSANLTNQLRKNPDYILPEGYKKVVEKKVDYFHSVALDAFDSSYTDVLNVLDEIVFQKLGLHILEPFSEITTNVYAKSVMSKKKEENTDDFKDKYFSLNVKKQLFKFSSEDRTIARQVAFCLSEITDAVHLGRTSIAKNKYSTKQLEEQRRRADEQLNRRRQKRDEELKRALEKQKGQKQQLQQKSAEQKAKEEKKAEEERKKREKYEQDLKKKVQEFQQKKKEQFKKEEQERLAQKKKQQQAFEKKRIELSKAAKQIQQKKEKEKKEAQQKEQLLKQKSKKNLKIRSSPKPLKKLTQEVKTQVKNLVNEKLNEKQNKNLAPVATKPQPKN